jgi:hypothetical protein
VLWINTRGEDVGIKFKVKRQQQRATNLPLMYSSDIELAVSYVIEFEGERWNINVCACLPRLTFHRNIHPDDAPASQAGGGREADQQ